MATSSIFANFNITDNKKAEAFVAALEASEKDAKRTPTSPVSSLITDHESIRNFFAKRKK